MMKNEELSKININYTSSQEKSKKKTTRISSQGKSKH